MSRLRTLTEADLSSELLGSLSAVRHDGRLSDVYLQFANSESALRTYLIMERCLGEGSLAEREIEAVKLLVSQRTGCEYCLSIHSVKAKRAGLNPQQQRAIRRGDLLGEDRLDSLLAIVRALFSQPGVLDEALLHQARKAGISDENLVDLAMAISTIFFTNITNHINDTALSMPPAAEV